MGNMVSGGGYKLRKIELVFVSLIFILILFTGCIGSNNVPPPPDEVARLQSVDVINYFKNEDIEGLKDMFCKTTSETHNLDKEIQGAFDYINGKIISRNNFV